MSQRHLIGRREFLIVSSTCALATATVGPKLFAGEGAAPKRLAFGFASLELNSPLMAASDIPAADGGFISRGARVVISGAGGVSPNPNDRRAVELLAHFSYMDGAERLSTPFRAWGSNRVTGCQGNTVGFNIPVDEVQKITFSLGVEQGATSAPPPTTSRRRAVGRRGEQQLDAHPIILSLQNEPGSLKLARGFYVIVPLFDGDSEPRWSSWTLSDMDGRTQLVDAAGASAPFEHFVLKTDYAAS